MNQNLIFVELNEINFDAVKYYLNNEHKLNGFQKLFEEIDKRGKNI